MADRLYTSVLSDEILSGLRFETKLEKYVLARIAFSVSIAVDGKNVPRSTDFSGPEMKRPTFIGSDELFLKPYSVLFMVLKNFPKMSFIRISH